jgi:hypothetical protein
MLMYWFDPDRGHSRRSRAMSHAGGVVRQGQRRASRRAGRQARHIEGRLKGAAMRASGKGRYHPESDADLREHLRQVIRSLPVPTGDVTVDVSAGRAALRGQIELPEHRLLIRSEVAKVCGVRAIESYLHLPGTPAPNKYASRNVVVAHDAY